MGSQEGKAVVRLEEKEAMKPIHFPAYLTLEISVLLQGISCHHLVRKVTLQGL